MKYKVRIGNKYWFDYFNRLGYVAVGGEIDWVQSNKVSTELELTREGLDELIDDAKCVADLESGFDLDLVRSARRVLVQLDKLDLKT